MTIVNVKSISFGRKRDVENWELENFPSDFIEKLSENVPYMLGDAYVCLQAIDIDEEDLEWWWGRDQPIEWDDLNKEDKTLKDMKVKLGGQEWPATAFPTSFILHLDYWQKDAAEEDAGYEDGDEIDEKGEDDRDPNFFSLGEEGQDLMKLEA